MSSHQNALISYTVFMNQVLMALKNGHVVPAYEQTNELIVLSEPQLISSARGCCYFSKTDTYGQLEMS